MVEFPSSAVVAVVAVSGTALAVEAARTVEAEVVGRPAWRARQKILPTRFHSGDVRTHDIG